MTTSFIVGMIIFILIILGAFIMPIITCGFKEGLLIDIGMLLFVSLIAFADMCLTGAIKF